MNIEAFNPIACEHCMKCMKACPMDALHYVHDFPQINKEKCIDCGRCLHICPNNGFSVVTSTLEHISDYKYTCLLLPVSFYTLFSDHIQIRKMIHAFHVLGFDDVVDLSLYNSAIMNNAAEFIKKYKNNYLLSSHCPSITKLIYRKYPGLVPYLIPMEYPSEIAARDCRAKIMKEKGLAKEEIGIFLLSECSAKLDLAKYPNENMEYEVDHAIAVNSISAILRKTMREVDGNIEDYHLSKVGVLYDVKDGIQRLLNDFTVINVDSIDKAMDILELVEFERLQSSKYISMSACSNGCVGGGLLWTNPFENRIQLEEIYKEAEDISLDLPFVDVIRDIKPMDERDLRTMKEKMDWFLRVKEIREKLPGFDCGACGYPNCLHMAEEIAKGHSQLSDCLIKSVKESE